jgi:hypothetical protein
MTVAISLILAALAAAQPSAPRCSTGEEAAAELRAAHETQRRAHLEGNADLMAPGMADQMVLVSNGEVLVNPKEKMIAFFKGYFGRVSISNGATPRHPWSTSLPTTGWAGWP